MSVNRFQSSFSPAVLQLADEWRNNAVSLTADAYRSLPKAPLYNILLGKLTPREMEIRNLPPLIGTGTLAWMENAGNDFVVAKNDAQYTENFGWVRTTAREKISADLGIEVGLPLLPVQIREISHKAEVRYQTITPRPFADTQTGPSDNILAADTLLAQVSVFDQWIKNGDRHRRQILYGSLLPGGEMERAFMDHGMAHRGKANEALPLLEEHIVFPDLPGYQPLPNWLREQVREQIRQSPEVEEVFQSIEKLPGTFITHTVNRLPDRLFTYDALKDPPEIRKQGLIDRLFYRRDNLRELTAKGYDL